MENENQPLNEKVEIDARSGLFRRTMARLEQNRNRKQGNSPVNFDGERKRFTVEIDGRTRGLREALKRVEMYRKMREEKKKTLMGMKKGYVEETEVSDDAENINESTPLTNGQIFDALDYADGWVVNEEELSPKQKKYREFFNAALKKFGAKSPADLDDAGKKKLFNYVKKNYKG